MRGVNKVILVGSLGKDPETKQFPNGGSLTQFSIATSDVWVDKVSGERKEQTEWHRIVLNNRLGEIAQQYLRKGSKVYIEGSLRTRKWTDQNGQERYSTEIRGDQLQMLDSRTPNEGGAQGGYNNNNNNQGGYGGQGGYNNNNNQAGGYGGQGGFNAPTQAPNYGNNNPGGFAPKAASPAAVPPADLDDDLPF